MSPRLSEKRRGARAERGDPTREKLLTASIEVFGRYGFDGATTRALADAAGVNLQAIPYYFGGKEGLYLAAAEHIGELIASHIGELRDAVRSRLAAADQGSVPLGREEAADLLTRILRTMAALFVSDESAPWARFLIREQMEPTEAFQRVYAGVMKPMLEVGRRLVGIILGEDPETDHVKLRTFTLLGGVMVFRMAHAAVLAELKWGKFGPRETEDVQRLAGEIVASLVTSGKST